MAVQWSSDLAHDDHPCVKPTYRREIHDALLHGYADAEIASLKLEVHYQRFSTAASDVSNHP